MSLFSFLFGGKKFGRRSVSTQTMELIRYEWKGIGELLAQKGPSQLRNALIKADKTLDNALRDIVAGENMGERLKNAKDTFDPYTYEKLWKAHKLRNSLVHESGFEPPHHMVTTAIENFRVGLQKIGVRV